MQFGFVFTNYNNSEVTKKLLLSLCSNIDYMEVVIVDNNSDPVNKQILKEFKNEFLRIHLLFNDENLGYFNGLNCGIKYLRKNFPNIEIVIIGNNDLIFPDDFISNLRSNVSLFHSFPVISPDIVTLDGEHQNPHVIDGISKIREIIFELYYSNYYIAQIIKKIAFITKFFSDRNDEKSFKKAQTIHQGYGACFILGPLFFRYYELLWAPTFLMGEEFFLSKQLEAIGYKYYYEPKICVTHLLHATMNKMPNKKMWAIAKNSHKIYKKYRKNKF